MQFIQLSRISIPPDRQRQEFDPTSLVELMNSIQNLGLLHPIIIRRSSEGPVLVAGERRIKAIKDITALGGNYVFEGQEAPEGAVPAIDLGDINDLTASEAEFDENDKRKNVSWQEHALATSRIARLHALRAEAAGAPAPSVADIAREKYPQAADLADGEMGAYGATVKKELIVAKHFGDPEVAGAKTLGDAFKHLQKKEDRAKRAELAVRVGATFGRASHRLLNQDSARWLVGCAEGSFDVVLTDPPFGMGADSFGDAGAGFAAHSYEDDASVMEAILEWLPGSLSRVSKPAAHLYWFCDIQWFDRIGLAMEEQKWEVHRTPLIWHKPNGFRAPWPEYGPQRRYELILYAVRGKKPCQLLAGDVLTHPLEPQSVGPQKPVALFAELLARSCRPGDTVLDPFCGSGPIFPAAHQRKVLATGIEKDPATYAKAMKRLEELK